MTVVPFRTIVQATAMSWELRFYAQQSGEATQYQHYLLGDLHEMIWLYPVTGGEGRDFVLRFLAGKAGRNSS